MFYVSTGQARALSDRIEIFLEGVVVARSDDVCFISEAPDVVNLRNTCGAVVQVLWSVFRSASECRLRSTGFWFASLFALGIVLLSTCPRLQQSRISCLGRLRRTR